MPVKAIVTRFCHSSEGAIAVAFAVALPVLLVLGGMAVDFSQINALKRDAQGLADSAALAAAPLLPDRVAARARVNAMLAAAESCPSVQDCPQAAVPQITFLQRDDEGDLQVSTDPAETAVAIEVSVAQDYDPILLGPVLPREALAVTQSATAQKTPALPGIATFTLRNQLLSINTQDSLLGLVLEPLGLGLTVNALGSEGLANARVRLDDLLGGLLGTGLAVEALTFDEVLKLPIALDKLLYVALRDPANPDGPLLGGVEHLDHVPDRQIQLADIMEIAPQLLNLKVGDVLPDIELPILDILAVAANLAAGETQRLGLGLKLELLDPSLLGAQVSLGLIRSHATGIASAGEGTGPHAVLRQTDLDISAGLLSVLRLDVGLGIAGAEARLTELNCQAPLNGDLPFAVFEVSTYPLSAAIEINILNKEATKDATIPDGQNKKTALLASAVPHEVVFTRDQYEQGLRTQEVKGGLTISNLGNSLKELLGNVNFGPQAGNCGWNVFQCLIDAITGLLGTLVQLVADLLTNVIPLDAVVFGLIEALGIDVAAATLTLEAVDCAPENLGPARLIN